MDYSLENLSARYQSVPLEIRLALSSEEFMEKIFAIGERHQLLLDQSDALSEKVGLVMLGVLPRQEFRKEVQNLGIPEEVVDTVTADINAEIFEPLKKSLIAASEERDEDISREDLLREIETPSPARFRTEPATNASLLEKHNERVLGSSVTPPKAPEIPTEVEPTLPAPIALDHELPPPHTDTLSVSPAPEPKSEVPQAPKEESAPIIQSPRKVTEIHPELRPAIRKGSVDPYREPIE